MAAFPSYVKLGLGSSIEQEQGWQDSISAGGTLHSIQKHGTNYWLIDVLWPAASGQNYANIKAVYDAGPRDTMTAFNYYLSSPTLTLSVIFLEPPQIVANHGGDKYDIKLTLRGS